MNFKLQVVEIDYDEGHMFNPKETKNEKNTSFLRIHFTVEVQHTDDSEISAETEVNKVKYLG